MLIAAHNGARIWGGGERALTRLLLGLRSRGNDVLLYCNSPLVAENARAAGVPTAVLPLGGDVVLTDAIRFAARLRKLGPDALIIGTYKKLLLASLGGRLGGVPRVLARVGLETDVPRSAKYRLALSRWVDNVVVNAQRIRQPFEEFFRGEPGRVHLIHNGVNSPARRLPDGELRRTLGIPPSAPVVGAVARLDVQKRLDRLLEAVARLDGVRCVLAGDGPERRRLESLASSLGIEDRVHFLGSREDVGDVYAALDVMVVTSDREGLSNSMLEAMASGVPVVSTPVSGATDALEPLDNGRRPGVVVGFDVGEITAALAAILGDPAGRAEMAEAARERARSRFSFERMIDRWEEVLRGIPSNRTSP